MRFIDNAVESYFFGLPWSQKQKKSVTVIDWFSGENLDEQNQRGYGAQTISNFYQLRYFKKLIFEQL